ncbi:Nuclear localization sequence-binding protein [Metarhizium anisopliae]
MAKSKTKESKKADAALATKAADSSDSEEDSDDSDDSSEDDSEESGESKTKTEDASASKKRKADEEIDATPKKAKTEGAPTLFAGNLSWNIDDNALAEAFKEFEGLVGARVVTDRDGGRSRGFGYVDFETPEAATKAYEAMQGFELDGRPLNLDYANTRPAESNPRDRATDRAKKHGDSVSPESETLFIGNLPFDTDQETVRQFFAEVAEVTSVRLPTDP